MNSEFWNAIQAASNQAAGIVSGPVDIASWLLRKAGAPVPENALLSSKWMEEQGLMRQVKPGVGQMVGDTIGLLAPIAAAAKAPQIAAAAIKGGENLATRRTLNPQTGAIVYHGSPSRGSGSSELVPAAPNKTAFDVLPSNAKDGGELPVSGAGVIKGLGALDIKSRNDMLSMVRGLVHDDEVAKAVVGSIPVDVVNVLGGKKITPEMLRHNPAMLIDLLPADANHLVPSSIKAVDEIAARVAAVTAKNSPLIGANSGSPFVERLAAGGADEGFKHIRNISHNPLGDNGESSLRILERNGQGLLNDPPKPPALLGLPERVKAFETAQRNAAKPLSEGGLGLGPNNTAADRSKALGFDTDVYHGGTNDFPAFQSSRPTYATDEPRIADIYANATGRHLALRDVNAGPNVMPLKLSGKELTVSDLGEGGSGWFPDNLATALGVPARRGLVNDLPKHGYDRLKVINMTDLGGEQVQHMIPAGSPNIRSRFAAFDPARRNEADLLGGADPYLLSLLGLGAGGAAYFGQK